MMKSSVLPQSVEQVSETVTKQPLTAIDKQISTGLWLPARSLWWRELVRFYRQRSRVAGVLGSPLVFWLLLGSGLGDSFRIGGASLQSGYLEYFFPGTLTMILLFTSIFCMMTVIEDRREGFLLSVLVSPAPRASLVLGKVLGGATLATLQAMIFVLLAPVIGIPLGLLQLLALGGVLFLIAFALTGVGFFIAWRLDSTHGFHALINLFLLPMWILSGSVFPISGASSWIGYLMRLNPLTYGLVALRRLLYWQSLDSVASGSANLPSLAISLVVTAGFATLTFFMALGIASRQRQS
ncbi:MAG: ABC transporter permease [Acidobacteriota bacterium]